MLCEPSQLQLSSTTLGFKIAFIAYLAFPEEEETLRVRRQLYSTIEGDMSKYVYEKSVETIKHALAKGVKYR